MLLSIGLDVPDRLGWSMAADMMFRNLRMHRSIIMPMF